MIRAMERSGMAIHRGSHAAMAGMAEISAQVLQGGLNFMQMDIRRDRMAEYAV